VSGPAGGQRLHLYLLLLPPLLRKLLQPRLQMLQLLGQRLVLIQAIAKVRLTRSLLMMLIVSIFLGFFKVRNTIE
jgi:hypothetical protein